MTLRVIWATRGVGSRHQKRRAVRQWIHALLGAASGSGGRLSCKLTAAERHRRRHEFISLRQVVPQSVLYSTTHFTTCCSRDTEDPSRYGNTTAIYCTTDGIMLSVHSLTSLYLVSGSLQKQMVHIFGHWPNVQHSTSLPKCPAYKSNPKTNAKPNPTDPTLLGLTIFEHFAKTFCQKNDSSGWMSWCSKFPSALGLHGQATRWATATYSTNLQCR